MRLICPNCDAQYEVDDSAIPDGGRDVQCSNCGHAWYQMPVGAAGFDETGTDYSDAADPLDDPAAVTPPDAAPDTARAAATAGPVRQDNAADDVSMEETPEGALAGTPDPDQPDPDQPDVEPAETASPGFDAGMDADAPMPEPPMPEPPMSEATVPRRSLDENLLAVLKEEAEREAAARRAEQQRPIETQTDLGLEEPGKSTALRDRLARLRAPEPEPEPETVPQAEPEITARPGARRDLLPDIEEINSTLRASSETRPGSDALSVADMAAPRGGSGFRSGFFLMVFLAVLAAAAYVAAPRIIDQFPAAEDAMTRYVAGVNHLRAGLDGLLQRATGGLQSMGGGD